MAQLRDGRVALGGIRGLNLFDPARWTDSAYTPPLRLLSARIGADASDKDRALWQPQALSIPDGAELLRLRVGALDYAPAAGLRYRYRMDGFDREWIDNGPLQDITYTRLPPGRYTPVDTPLSAGTAVATEEGVTLTLPPLGALLVIREG